MTGTQTLVTVIKILLHQTLEGYNDWAQTLVTVTKTLHNACEGSNDMEPNTSNSNNDIA